MRLGHDMVLDLPAATAALDEPDLPAGVALRAGVASVSEMVRARLAAYPPGHPDAGPRGRPAAEHEADVVELLAGRAAGLMLRDASAVASDAAGALVGAVMVARSGPEPWGWPGGAWVADVLVTPDWQGRGVGRALLRHAIARCTAAGEGRIGLTVTDGNPAERLYRALGFERRRTVYVLEI